MINFTDSEWSSNNGSVFSDGECISICQLHGIPKNKADANADLMAAAPDMYKLLERYHDESRFVYGEDYDEVEELLNKARGEIK